MFIPNFKILHAVVPENDEHETADSLLHNTTSHTQCLYQILGSVVSEKSLTKKKFTHRQTLLLKRQNLYIPFKWRGYNEGPGNIGKCYTR